MKKIKYIICGLIIIIVTLIVILLNLNKIQYSDEEEDFEYDEETESAQSEQNIHFSDYSIIKQCIQKYIDYLYKNNSVYYEKQEDGSDKYIQDIQEEVVYALLNESFINENNLSKDRLFEKIQTYTKKQGFFPVKIDILNNSNVKVYKVYGIIQDLEYVDKQNIYCILSVDCNEKTFNIIPTNSEIFNSYELKDNIEKINNKDYNMYNSSVWQEEQIATEYFEAYRFLTLANPKFTYEKMSEEYRNKRFGTLENYIQYIKDNYTEFKNITPKKYLSSYNGQYSQYVIQDQNENYYIFDTIDALNYNVSLDTYTIYTEKFKTSYQSANNKDKVQMNIDKFFQMINRQDYRTSYSVLDESFKNNNIKTQEDFKKIAKNRFFTYNKINYIDYTDLGSNTYAFSIKLTDLTEQRKDEINMTIIMKLKEGTDFAMSFSFN